MHEYPLFWSKHWFRDSMYTVLAGNFETLKIWPLALLCTVPIIHSSEQNLCKFFFKEIKVLHVKFSASIRHQKNIWCRIRLFLLSFRCFIGKAVLSSYPCLFLFCLVLFCFVCLVCFCFVYSFGLVCFPPEKMY